MKHVDEGLLHAYLDRALDPTKALQAEVEAHITACACCSARLDEARAIRDTTQLILQDLGEIAELAALRSPLLPPSPAEPAAVRAGGAFPRRFGSLALAASLVLALGGTWVLREHRVQEDMEVILASVGTVEGDAIAGSGTAPEETVPNTGVPREAGSTGERTIGRVATLNVNAAVAPPAAEATVEGIDTAAFPVAAQPGVQGHPVPSATSETGSVLIVASSSAPEARTEDEIVPLRDLPRVSTRDGGVAAKSVAEQDLPRTRPAHSNSPGARRPAPPSRRPGPLGGFRRSVPSQPSAATWTRTSQNDAERRLGAPILHVEGLPLTGIWIATDRAGSRVQSFQLLENGAGLELVQWRESAAESGRREQSTGAGETEVIRSGTAAGSRVIRTEENRNGSSTVLLQREATGSMLSLTAAVPLDSLLRLVPRVRELD